MSDFKAEMHQNRILAGALPQTPLGELTAPPDLAGYKWPTSKGRGGKGKGKGRQGRGEEGKGKEWEYKKFLKIDPGGQPGNKKVNENGKKVKAN